MEKLTVSTSAFGPNGMIPSKYTCDGENISPGIAWSVPPAGTKSLALISDDPDAPAGTWVHWVIFNIPQALASIPEGVPKGKLGPGGAVQGMTDFGCTGYGGPCPPGGTHRYYFKIYALDVTLSLFFGRGLKTTCSKQWKGTSSRRAS